MAAKEESKQDQQSILTEIARIDLAYPALIHYLDNNPSVAGEVQKIAMLREGVFTKFSVAYEGHAAQDGRTFWKIIEQMAEVADSLQKCEQRAGEIIAAVSDAQYGLERILLLEPVDGLTVLAIMSKMRDEIAYMATRMIEQAVKQSHRQCGKKTMTAQFSKDAKQVDKLRVKECWDDWQQNPTRYSSKAAFARAMLTKFENLTSALRVVAWCRRWEWEIVHNSTKLNTH